MQLYTFSSTIISINTLTLTVTPSGRRSTLSVGKPYFVPIRVPRTQKSAHFINTELDRCMRAGMLGEVGEQMNSHLVAERFREVK